MEDRRIKVNLNEFNKLKLFAREVVKFESDVNIIRGHLVYDAKSLLAVIAIDPNEDTYVEIISNDETEINNFRECMKEFT